MGSQSRQAFSDNSKDVERLLGIARNERDKGTAQAVLKSAIVLITAFWEAYCEDIASEGLDHMITHAIEFDELPKKLRQDVAQELKGDKNELAVWNLAADGWRDVVTARLATYTQSRTGRFNTPKPAQVDELFEKALGISEMSNTWKVRKPRRRDTDLMTANEARAQLTEFIELRGAIAHRGYVDTDVNYQQVSDYYMLVKRIVAKTGGRVNSHVKKATGIPLWEQQ